MNRTSRVVSFACSFAAITGLALSAGSRAEGQGIPNMTLWTDPAPGEYEVQPAASMCLERVSGGSIFVSPHLAIGDCNPNLFGQSLEVAPAGRDGIDVSGATRVTWRITNGNECATVARNVAFGAPRVDMLPCDDNGSDRTFAGARDQRFTLLPVGSGRVAIVTQDRRCWTAEGGNPRVSGKIFVESCEGRPGQSFALNRSGGLATAINTGAAEFFGWTRLSGNPVFDRQFRLPNLNLPSGDYSWAATANDQGVECARRCADDASCKAYTWVDPRNRGGTPMCYKKNAINAPSMDVMTQSGIIRP
jgi:PAN domain